MNCRDVTRFFTQTDRDSYPENVLNHIAECDRCRTLLEQQRFAVQMLSIKRHERRGTDQIKDAEDCVCHFISGGYGGPPDPETAHRFLRPTLSLAAALALIVAVGWLVMRADTGVEVQMAESRPIPVDFDYGVLMGSQPDWITAVTNAAPSQIQYGPLRSRLVGFEVERQ